MTAVEVPPAARGPIVPDPLVQPSLFDTGCGWCVPCYATGAQVLAVDERRGSVCAGHATTGLRAAAAFPSPAPAEVVAAAAALAVSGALERPESPESDGRVGPAVAAVLAAWRPAQNGAGGLQTAGAVPSRVVGRVRGPSRRPGPARPGPARPGEDRAAALARARRMRAGRARAAARIDGPSSDPHPGARHRITPGYRIIHDQREALALIATLVAAEPWRADRRRAWTAVLRRLVHSIDWQTGFISRVTLDQLGSAGGRGRRTVARVRAWAESVGLLAVVEDGATAEFLGSHTNRTPTYAFTTNAPLPTVDTLDNDTRHETTDDGPPDASPATNPQVNAASDQLGNPSLVRVGIKPSARRLEPPAPDTSASWPLWQVPETPAQRSAAALRLIERIGLDHPGVCRAAGRDPGRPDRPTVSSSTATSAGSPSSGRRTVWPTRRLAGLLKPWWDTGASVAGLLYALDHHPDHPTHHRGDALRGARDPLAVLGARLRPWRNRLHELPATLVGLRGDYLTAQTTRLAAQTGAEPSPAAAASGPTPSDLAAWTPHSRTESRAAAHAALAAARAATRARRTHNPAQRDLTGPERPDGGQPE